MNERTKPAMDFERAKQYMEPMEVTDCLNKTLDFLRNNSLELRFPDISTAAEDFLVNLVLHTRNLKCRSFTEGDKRIALEIIEVLELNREVFRFAYSYENGKANSKVLTYKKIYTNKMKKKRPTKTSSVAHRLIQSLNSDPEPPQSKDSTISSNFKLDFLNRTLRFIKNDSERTLYYNEMLIPQAEYIQSVVQTNGDNHVGFGFKALYAPLWEAMDQLGEVFRLKITLTTQRQGYATLKLEKILKQDNSLPRPENNISKADKVPVDHEPTEPKNDAPKEPEPKIIGGKKKRKRSKKDKSGSTNSPVPSTLEPSDQQLISKLSPSFMRDTLQALARFAADEGSASLTFGELNSHGMCFVRKVKGWAASPEERNKFPPELRELLLRLGSAVSQTQQRYRITTSIRGEEGSITLKKTPLFVTPPPPSPVKAVNKTPVPVARSKSLAAPSLTVRSTSKNRTVQFQTADSLQKSDPTAKAKERGRSASRVTNRKAKLLEDLNTPIESDKGMRMMLLMGWDGGSLGTRGDGITEPIMPNINMASKAGLGHVPKAKCRDFREAFFQALSELVAGEELVTVMQYKEPIPKADRKFIPNTLHLLNCRRPPAVALSPLGIGFSAKVLQDLVERPQIYVAADISKDFRTIKLSRTNKQEPTNVMSNATTKGSHNVFLSKEDIEVYMATVEVPIPDKLKDRQFYGMVKKKRAARMLFLTVIEQALRSEAEEIRVHFAGEMQATWVSFIKATIVSLNTEDYQRHVNDKLLVAELEVYGEMRRASSKWHVAIEFHGRSHFVLKRTRINCQPISNDTPGGPNNNNDDKVNDRNDGHTDRLATAADNDDGNVKEISSNVDCGSSKLMAALEKHINNDNAIINNEKENNGNDAIITKDGIEEDKIVTNNDVVIKEMENSENNAIINKGMENNDNNAFITKDEQVKDEDATNNDVVIKKEIVESKEETDFDCDYESDFDKEMDLEMATCKAELEYNVKEEKAQCDLETKISCDVDGLVKTEVDDPNNLAMRIDDLNITKPENAPGHKRPSTNVNSFEKIDPKRRKMTIGNVVIISHNDCIAYDLDTNFMKDVQMLISDEIDKTGVLPLLKCYGIQKRGLVYSGHSKEDTDWLKNFISKVKYLNYKIDSDDESIAKENRVAIKINTALNLCAKDIFRRFEMYNPGLNTASWKVMASRGIKKTFYLIVVEIDDVSLRYISDEKFSLYCGVDCAHFTVLY